MILKYFATYTSVYWRNLGIISRDYQIHEYGHRVGYEIPVTMLCLQCRDNVKGGGVNGFNTESQNFLCMCKKENVATYCAGMPFFFFPSPLNLL